MTPEEAQTREDAYKSLRKQLLGAPKLVLKLEKLRTTPGLIPYLFRAFSDDELMLVYAMAMTAMTEVGTQMRDEENAGKSVDT